MYPKRQVSHHMRYLEIDGEEYTIPITSSAHQTWHRIHPGLNIGRSPSSRLYRKRHWKRKKFTTLFEDGNRLCESIRVNDSTRSITVTSYFENIYRPLYRIKEK